MHRIAVSHKCPHTGQALTDLRLWASVGTIRCKRGSLSSLSMTMRDVFSGGEATFKTKLTNRDAEASGSLFANRCQQSNANKGA